MQASLLEQLLEQVSEKAITPKDLHRAALHLIDWVACCAGVRNSSVAQAYQQVIEQEDVTSSKVATNLFTGADYWLLAAAKNGALGNVLEMDDVHRSSILHPGPIVIPAALAMAERQQSSIQSLLEAIILGYELTIRLGQAIGRSHYQYFHNTSTCGAIGGAMAASYLLGLNLTQTISALGNALSRTGGLWQMRNEKVQTKQWHNSEAVKSGLNAALLAQQNLAGPAYILEGPQGVFAGMSQDAQPSLFIDVAEQWRIYDCSFKPWPACRHAHPAIDVISAILNEDSITAIDSIKHIEIATYQDALTFCHRPNPTTELEAKFSIEHAVAARLLWGEPKVSHYQQAAFENPLAVVLRAKVSLVADIAIEQQYPQHYGARVTIEFDNGEESRTLALRDTLGDPERPLSMEQLISKVQMLCQLGEIEQENIDGLCALQWLQESELSALIQLLKP